MSLLYAGLLVQGPLCVQLVYLLLLLDPSAVASRGQTPAMWTVLAKQSVASSPGLPSEPPRLTEDRVHLGSPACPQTWYLGSPPGTQGSGSNRPGSAALSTTRSLWSYKSPMCGKSSCAQPASQPAAAEHLLPPFAGYPGCGQAVAPPAGFRPAVDTAGLTTHPAGLLLHEQARQAPPKAAPAIGLPTFVSASGALHSLFLFSLLLWPAATVDAPVGPVPRLAPRLWPSATAASPADPRGPQPAHALLEAVCFPDGVRKIEHLGPVSCPAWRIQGRPSFRVFHGACMLTATPAISAVTARGSAEPFTDLDAPQHAAETTCLLCMGHISEGTHGKVSNQARTAPPQRFLIEMPSSMLIHGDPWHNEKGVDPGQPARDIRQLSATPSLFSWNPPPQAPSPAPAAALATHLQDERSPPAPFPDESVRNPY